MEALRVSDGIGFSSITSDFENWRHNESISRVGVEGELSVVLGVRRHSTEGISTDGRSEGGYVVGNAWGGVGTEERGVCFWWKSQLPCGGSKTSLPLTLLA